MEALLTLNPLALLAIILWTLLWKAWSLWLSARRGDFWWFMSIIFISIFGIVEIVYIFLIAKQSDKKEEKIETTNIE